MPFSRVISAVFDILYRGEVALAPLRVVSATAGFSATSLIIFKKKFHFEGC
jgi:hypothetical protein